MLTQSQDPTSRYVGKHEIFISAIIFFAGPSENLPAIISGPTNKTVFESRETDFTCEITGNPKPVVNWYKKGSPVPLTNSSKYLTVTYQQWTGLIIRNIEMADSGTYICKARNKLGEVFKMAYLVVNGVCPEKKGLTEFFSLKSAFLCSGDYVTYICSNKCGQAVCFSTSLVTVFWWASINLR